MKPGTTSLFELEGRYAQLYVWILGAGPSLPKSRPGRPRIGLNYTWRVHPLDLFVSGHPEAIEDCPKDVLRIYPYGGEGKLFENEYGVLEPLRRSFNLSDGLPRTFDRELPALMSRQNSAFNAIHLAYIMGAAGIIFSGVEMNDQKHFWGEADAPAWDSWPHEETFRQMFSILKADDVDVLTVDPDSIVARAGATVLEEWYK